MPATKGAEFSYQMGVLSLLAKGTVSISYQAGDACAKQLTEGLILRKRVFPFRFQGAVPYQVGGAPESGKSRFTTKGADPILGFRA
jgi:hypothetical protein